MDGSNTSVSLRRVAVHVWAVLTLVSTFILLCSGGIVTSKGVGMSVPDWPTTYGYNMFLFPISGWVGGIFYEHGHRLIASWVGLMTMILAASLLASEPRRWVKRLGIIAFLAVCIQGLLGGLRVTLYKDEIGIFHAMLAQSFFCLLGILAIVTSPRFLRGGWDVFLPDSGLKKLVVGAAALIFLQLGLGATMRHEHAGLAIPDFPLAYGKILPDTSTSAIATINEARVADDKVPTNALHIWIQMAHRAVAVIIFLAVAAVAWRAFSNPIAHSARLWAAIWLVMISAQVALGAWTIWSNKAADVATAHMALGALSLIVGVVFTFRLWRGTEAARFVVPDRPSISELARTA
jgi:cytochrome c oxidase assembly protein subunit 15